jgi:hypothetical protein
MHMRSYEYCRIDGDTSYEEREALIDQYVACRHPACACA